MRGLSPGIEVTQRGQFEVRRRRRLFQTFRYLQISTGRLPRLLRGHSLVQRAQHEFRTLRIRNQNSKVGYHHRWPFAE